MTAPSQNKNASASRVSRELTGLLSIFLGILLFLSLATFDGRDPWLNHVVSTQAKVFNRAGLFGAYVSGFLFDIFGIAAWVVPVFFCFLGVRQFLNKDSLVWWRWCGFLSFVICLSLAGAARDLHFSDFIDNTYAVPKLSTHGGGLWGHFLYSFLVNWLSLTGSTVLWIFLLFFSVHLVFGFTWFALVLVWLKNVVVYAWHAISNMNFVRKTAPQIQQNQENFTGFESTDDNFEFEDDNKEVLNPLPPRTAKKTGFLSWLKAKNEEPEWLKDFEDGRYGLDTNGKSFEPLSLEEQATMQKQCQLQPEEKNTKNVKELSVSFDTEPLGNIAIAEVQQVELAEQPNRAKAFVQGLVKKSVLPLPALNLLEASQSKTSGMSKSILEAKGKNLMTCLTDFGIQCELVGITPGPVVTMFELRPAPGVRVSRIAALSDDLALALKAVAVRVQAPIPGTDTVGIEIPNEVREIVCFKELVSSKVFQESPSLLTLALGKDTSGAAAVANLATMPHLLVAGATGAGKSVGINSILLSILLKARPDEVKLLLVDPKRVEMAIYADLPHLVHPVVTEMSTAKNALDWAVMEMERRYTDIARAGVRNIADYNEKLKKFGDRLPPELVGLSVMPYLVLIIDELADLMLVAAKEVETSIVRLAQLARAAGIHLILATQRPSVDVVTGLIKANFPCRIAFQVTSKHDSRTILDTVGAEHLLGKGDMLFKPSGGKFQRLHGAFVSDKNVNAVVDYWRAQQKPEYSLDFTSMSGSDTTTGFAGAGAEDILGDPMYAEACDFIRQQDKVSISLIQRRFRIGFNKAARFVEQMEQDGIVTPADGAKPRTVVR